MLSSSFSFLPGVIAATFWWQTSAHGFVPLEPTTSQLVRGGGAMFLAAAVMLAELGLSCAP